MEALDGRSQRRLGGIEIVPHGRLADEPCTDTTPTSSAAANTIASSRERPVRPRVSSPARTMDVLRTGSSRPCPPAATAPATMAVRSARPAWGSHTGQPVTACGTATEAPQA